MPDKCLLNCQIAKSKKKKKRIDVQYMLINHLRKSSEIFNYVCLDASTKLGLKTFKIQLFLHSTAQSSYISHLLSQLRIFLFLVSQLSHSLWLSGHFKYFLIFMLFLLSSLVSTYYKSSSKQPFKAPQNTAFGPLSLLFRSLFLLLKRTYQACLDYLSLFFLP